MTKIAIILLNWKGAEDTMDCIESIAAQTGTHAFKTIIVDNDSGDDSPNRIAAFCKEKGITTQRLTHVSSRQAIEPHAQQSGSADDHADVVIIEADSNLGFCNGNNLGARFAFDCGADAAFILNNDTTVAPDMVEHLAAAASELGPKVLISPQILYSDTPDTIWWLGGSFSKTLSPSYGHQGEKKKTDIKGYLDSEWVSGCSTLISRELFDEIGLYDPLFFIWCEEWDLSLRARSKGIALKVAPKSIVFHKVGKSLGIISPLTFFYAMRNMIYLRRRYLSLPVRALFSLIYIPVKVFQAANYAIRFRTTRYLRAFVDALFDSDGGIWKRQ